MSDTQVHNDPTETRSAGMIAMLAGIAAALVLSSGALIMAAAGSSDGSAAAGADTAAAASEPPTEVSVGLDEMTISPASLEVASGGTLEVLNEGTVPHDLMIEGTDHATPSLDPGASHSLSTDDLAPGTHTVYCGIPGHREAGMEATLVVGGTDAATATPVAAGAGGGDGDVLPELVPKADLAAAPDDEINVAVAPEMPPAATRSEQAIVDVHFEVVENVSTIDSSKGTQHETWGYRLVDGPDSLVIGTPGPVIRARVGDVLRFTVTNPAGNQNPHNVDFHAVTGQGGGAEATVVAPGETRTIEARMLYPGFFMYHCAYGDVPSHISHGMFGGILVDPATPLPEVDHEWYMVQSEYYLADSDEDVKELDRAAVTDESPSHVVFNGAVGALAGDNSLQMQVGERSRIYFVNAGLNLTSNFHPIGSHWDAVYQEAALLNEPLRGSQTTLVPAGGGTVVDMIGQVPQTVLLVDHALSRAFDKGAIGMVVISGDENPEIFEEVEAEEPDGTEEPSGEPVEEPAGDGSAAAPTDGTSHEVAILAGSSEFHEIEDHPGEFADDEQPADYDVNVLEIQVGDTVTWTNDDAMMHTATAADGSFDSGLLDAGESWSYTFTEAGEFEYLCTPHPWMRAKVLVTA